MQRTYLLVAYLALSDLTVQAQTSITITLYDIAGVRPGVLATMKTETSSIFRAAGVELEWVDCAFAGKPVRNAECAIPLGPTRFMLRLVPGVNKTMPGVAGLAFVKDGAGVLVCLYPERTRELARDSGWDSGDLLGHTAAHELGHLVLRSEAHTEGGLMRARWEAQDLRRLSHAGLIFLPGQLRVVLAEMVQK
jgi:hypothetical protein